MIQSLPTSVSLRPTRPRGRHSHAVLGAESPNPAPTEPSGCASTTQPRASLSIRANATTSPTSVGPSRVPRPRGDRRHHRAPRLQSDPRRRGPGAQARRRRGCVVHRPVRFPPRTSAGDSRRGPAPFKPSRPIVRLRHRRRRSRPRRADGARLERAEPFYIDVLGFALRPRREGIQARFFHCNPRHHTLAFSPVPGLVGMHHLMLEVTSSTMSAALDLVPGKSSPGDDTRPPHQRSMTSFYVRTPSGFEIEYGAGGRLSTPRALGWPRPVRLHELLGPQPDRPL